jgi:hypothetical protein
LELTANAGLEHCCILQASMHLTHCHHAGQHAAAIAGIVPQQRFMPYAVMLSLSDIFEMCAMQVTPSPSCTVRLTIRNKGPEGNNYFKVGSSSSSSNANV